MCRSASIIPPLLHWLIWAVMQGLALRVVTGLCTNAACGFSACVCSVYVLVAARVVLHSIIGCSCACRSWLLVHTEGGTPLLLPLPDSSDADPSTLGRGASRRGESRHAQGVGTPVLCVCVASRGRRWDVRAS